MNDLLRAIDLSKSFAKKTVIHQLSFELKADETLAIVGESGSGKSTLARLCMRLIDCDAGQLEVLGTDFFSLSSRSLRASRKNMQMVFQDPFASLNPRMRIASLLEDGLRVHHAGLSAKQRRLKIIQTLEECGLDETVMQRYPHQFSGGQRQRISIARALLVEPKILWLDEAVSALDVSVQAQILNLLNEIKQGRDLSYVFISHDLSVVQYMADRVLVMFAGRIVEEASVDALFQHARHPYTQQLLEARPVQSPEQRQEVTDAPLLDAIAETGCAFRFRCPHAHQQCEASIPILSQGLACHGWS